MIKKALISALAIILIYSLSISLIRPNESMGHTQKQENIIAVQKYIYGKGRETDYVIVGSSLGARLDHENLPQEYWNLSLRGKSIFEGLEIIKQSVEKPEIVMIEMNFIHRKGDQNFLNEIYKPIPFVLKKYFPILREEFQPVNLVVNSIKGLKDSLAEIGSLFFF